MIVIIRSEELQRFGRAHARGDAAGLQHHPDAGHELAMFGHRVESQNAHRTGSGAAIALEGLDGRGLARAIGTKESSDLPGHGRK